MHLPTEDFANPPEDMIAFLPVGSIEQHGPHMSVGADTLINLCIVVRVPELVDPSLLLLVLPTRSIGTSLEHLSYPGTLTYTPSEIMEMEIWFIALWAR